MILSRILAIACCLLLPAMAQAQSLNIDLGGAGGAGATGRLVQITALVTVLSLAPSLLVMVTAFTRIVIVLSLLRSALSTQSTPPNMVIISTLDASRARREANAESEAPRGTATQLSSFQMAQTTWLRPIRLPPEKAITDQGNAMLLWPGNG